MGSEVAFRLPTIDFRNDDLKPGSKEWISVRDKVYAALEEYGAFEGLLDKTPKEMIFEKLKEIFKLPLESKFENGISLSGYTKGNPKLAMQERLVISHPHTPGVIDTFSKKLWSDGDLEFCDMVTSYVKKIAEFDEMVRRMIFEKLGLMEKYWEEHTKSTSSILGLFKYRVPNAEEAKYGLFPHTDKHISTILSQYSDAHGLQMMKKSGEWIVVEYTTPDSFIFLVNDSLMALTNGRLHSPLHQVMMADRERYSILFSTIGKEGYLIKAPEELIDEDHPQLYKPYEALDLFRFSISDKGGATLENFCGVSTTN